MSNATPPPSPFSSDSARETQSVGTEAAASKDSGVRAAQPERAGSGVFGLLLVLVIGIGLRIPLAFQKQQVYPSGIVSLEYAIR